MTAIQVYVPDPDAPAHVALSVAGIDRGSGIVGTRTHQWHGAPDDGCDDLIIHYEGNRFGYANVHTFADRVRIAAARHIEHYPTIAMQAAPCRALVAVGSFYPEHGRVEITDARGLVALAKWLDQGTWELFGVDERVFAEQLRRDELFCTGVRS